MSKKLIAFNGSPRKNGNTSLLLDRFLEGAGSVGAEMDSFRAQELNLEYCRGCLRCNILGYCSIRDDDWAMLTEKIGEADVLVLASPVYFHHVSASLKKMIDRFRSFVQVQVTESGLLHTPHKEWKKDFVLLLTLGSSSSEDAKPVVDLFRFMTSILGPENKLHVVIANRQVVVNQMIKTEEELEKLYRSMKLPAHLAHEDADKNARLLQEAWELGKDLMS